jgi:hypothetical protein
MKRLIVILLLAATPAVAANWDQACNLQVQGYGACTPAQDGQAGVFFGYWMTTAEAVRARDVLATRYGYRATVDCTQERVDAGQCAPADLGDPFPNPEGKRDFADRKLRILLRQLVKGREVSDKREAITEVPIEIDGRTDTEDKAPELDG